MHFKYLKVITLNPNVLCPHISCRPKYQFTIQTFYKQTHFRGRTVHSVLIPPPAPNPNNNNHVLHLSKPSDADRKKGITPKCEKQSFQYSVHKHGGDGNWIQKEKKKKEMDTHSNSDVRRTARTQRRHLLVKMESFQAVPTGNGIFVVDFDAFHSLEWDTCECIFDSVGIIISVLRSLSI
ncbi:hypothetical protein CDAR_474531 [Caerostris darwini]|uniref:Uncharacterized protein n=1 Tax=Caerostris darwini TaxID=1538125 RepID=A0AAV4PP84_9ARAC|nr:hypothetical protein CDAR_474531 [Caerostris darwini]